MKQFAVIALAFLLFACDGDKPDPAPGTLPDRGEASVATQPAAGPRVVFLGDSLTAGLGVERDQAFPAVAARLLEDEGSPIQIVNAGTSGDTTAGGLRRLDWVLRQSPDVVVVGLGGNDGLRGLHLKASEENLRSIVKQSRESGASVLLLGMLIPPNYGPEYTAQFRNLYARIAKEENVQLVPFLLEGVGGDPALNQPDGIHPTAQGHQIIAKHILPQLREIVRSRAPAVRARSS